MNLLNQKSGFLFATHLALAAVFTATLLNGLFVTPANATTEWHIRDDASGGDCSLIGSWNAGSKTCTLSQDLTQGVVIDNDGVALDGVGHTVTGAGGLGAGNGVYLSGRTGVTIENLNVQKFVDGIRIDSSSNSIITGNIASNNYGGISLSVSHNNILTGNTALNNISYGIYVQYSDSNTLTGNIASNNHIGIASNGSMGDIFTGNTVSNNSFGINSVLSNTDQIYNNNFVDNSASTQVTNNGNLYNLASPIGGNYWSDFDTPAEGCADANSDGFCDTPHMFSGGQDNLPWTKKDGWLVPPTVFSDSVIAEQPSDIDHYTTGIYGTFQTVSNGLSGTLSSISFEVNTVHEDTTNYYAFIDECSDPNFGICDRYHYYKNNSLDFQINTVGKHVFTLDMSHLLLWSFEGWGKDATVVDNLQLKPEKYYRIAFQRNSPAQGNGDLILYGDSHNPWSAGSCYQYCPNADWDAYFQIRVKKSEEPGQKNLVNFPFFDGALADTISFGYTDVSKVAQSFKLTEQAKISKINAILVRGSTDTTDGLRMRISDDLNNTLATSDVVPSAGMLVATSMSPPPPITSFIFPTTQQPTLQPGRTYNFIIERIGSLETIPTIKVYTNLRASAASATYSDGMYHFLTTNNVWISQPEFDFFFQIYGIPVTPPINILPFWAEIKNTQTESPSGSLKIMQKDSSQPHSIGTIVLKQLPEDWAIHVMNVKDDDGKDATKVGYLWYQVKDETDGTTGWMKAGPIATPFVATYLPFIADKQQEFADKASTTIYTTRNSHAKLITKVIKDYYGNSSNNFSLYSSDDGKNKISTFVSNSKDNKFPAELIMAVFDQESGGIKFDNEVVTFDYGHGISQTTFMPYRSDISYLQTILKHEDSSIYPEGLITGMFKDATQNAIARFQNLYHLSSESCAIPVTEKQKNDLGCGTVGVKTRTKLNSLLISENYPEIPKIFRFDRMLSTSPGYNHDVLTRIDADGNIAIWDKRGMGSGIDVPPCDYIFSDSMSEKNNYRHCYSYRDPSTGYRSYIPHESYGNQTFKYFANTYQSIYANIKDGLRVLSDDFSESLKNNANPIPQLMGALYRYNGVRSYNALVGSKLEDLTSDYYSKYKDDLGDSLVLTDKEITALVKQLKNYTELQIYSPVELRVYDSIGQVTGIIGGVVHRDIPESDYDEEHEKLILFNNNETYSTRITGTDDGVYSLSLTHMVDGASTTVDMIQLPVVKGEVDTYSIDWDALSRGEQGTTISIDKNGDGVIEKTIKAGTVLTTNGFRLLTETIVDVDPDTLNRKNGNGVMTAYIELPTGFDVHEIDAKSVMLNGKPANLKPVAIGDYDKDGIPDLMVKFDRGIIVPTLPTNATTSVMMIAGKISHGDEMVPFSGEDKVKLVQ